MELTKSQRKVYQVIIDNPGVQNSDASLVAAVWRASGWDDDRTLEYNLNNVMNSETITRSRRYLHEKGLITYTREVHKNRMERYKVHLDQYGNHQVRWFS
jgi:hypothetical protein